MESIEILYDHYKETLGLSKEAQTRRNKNFVILCVPIGSKSPDSMEL